MIKMSAKSQVGNVSKKDKKIERVSWKAKHQSR